MIKDHLPSLQTAAAQEILQSLDPADPRTAHRLTSHTSTYKQTSANNKKQYTNQYK
jgi:hypothetical protein